MDADPPPADPAPAAQPSHVATGPSGSRSRMVDVGDKPVTRRAAVARAVLELPARAATALAGVGPKGPIEEIARAAGLLAAKRTGELIPMCHPLGLDHVDVTFHALDETHLEIRCRAACRGRTGIEMEAMTGAAVAALTVYDMTKALDPGIRIVEVALVEKRGGKSGVWRREEG